jgi:hypothetical protein
MEENIDHNRFERTQNKFDTMQAICRKDFINVLNSVF